MIYHTVFVLVERGRREGRTGRRDINNRRAVGGRGSSPVIIGSKSTVMSLEHFAFSPLSLPKSMLMISVEKKNGFFDALHH